MSDLNQVNPSLPELLPAWDRIEIEHRRMEEALRQKDAWSRLVNEQVPAVLWTTDRELRFTSSVGAGLAHLSLRPNQVVGMSLFDYFQTDDPEFLPIRAQRQAIEGQSAHYEMEWQGRTFQVHVEPVFNNEKQVLGSIGLALDISDRKRTEAELVRVHERFQLAAAAGNCLIYEWDVETNIVERTQGTAGLLGYRPEEAAPTADWWLERIHPDDRQRVWDLISTALAGGGAFVAEYRIRHKNNQYLHVWDRGLVKRDAAGRSVRVVGCSMDMTERKRTEEALRKSEIRFRAMIENSWDGLALLSAEGIIVYASPATTRLLGYQVEEFVGQNVFDRVHPDDLPALTLMFQQLLQQPGATTMSRVRYRHLDGSWRWLEGSGTNLLGEPSVRAVVANYHDITEKKQSEETLRDYTERLQILSHRLMEAQEAERRHLARELHDEIGQLLTGLNLTLEMSVGLSAEQARPTLKEAQARVHELTARVRDLSLRLRPTMLDDLGLVPALLWHLERYTAQTNVSVAFSQTGLGRRLAPEVETSAYRIVQEALTNIARHAGIKEAAVSLWADADILRIQVEDRGRGFEPAAVMTPSTSSGLAGMRERGLLLGGRLKVESAPGSGTCLTAELPLHAPVKGTSHPDESHDSRAGG